MEKFKEYAFGGGSIGSYKPMADLGDYDNLHAAEEKKITQSDLDQIEKYADRLFASLDIDVEFTRHFMDRVNDARNIKQITVAELIRLFKQAYRRHGKKIAKLPDQANAVINDMKTNINLPFVLKYKKGEIELVAKTVMRKKNFTTSASSPKLSFESLQHKLDEASAPDIKKGDTIILSKSKRPYSMAGIADPKTILPAESDKMVVHAIRKTKDGRKAHLRYHDPKKRGGFAIYLDKMPDFMSVKIAEKVELDEIATGNFAPITHQMSLAELIFDSAGYGSDMSATSTVRGGAGSVANNMWMPLSGSIFDRAFPKKVRATVFHITKMANFDQLYAIQNPKHSKPTL